MSSTTTTTTAGPQGSNDGVNARASIKLYTNHGCGWSHRVHIVLRELGLKYEEVLIDMDVPRPDWFLKLNPRGLVPVFQYTPPGADEPLTLTESAQIVSFITDLYPSQLFPAVPNPPMTSENVRVVHLRYKMSFFVDTYFTKIVPLMFKLVGADAGESQEKIVDEILGLLEKEIEPLLAKVKTEGTGEYFAGSKEFTFAEAMSAPFVVRMMDFSNGVIFPTRLAVQALDEKRLPHYAAWAKLCMQHPSVTATWDKEYFGPRIEARLPAAKKKYAPKKE